MMAKRYYTVGVVLSLLVVLGACSTKKILMPPRMDLRTVGTIGMLDFSPRAAGNLNVQASREFLAVIHSAQPGVPILELGNQQVVLTSLGHRVIDPAAIRAIGEQHHVDVVVVGTLDARQVKPSFRLGRAAESVSAGAEIGGALTVRMYETRSGATIWTASSTCSEPLASIRVADGELSSVGASDPGGAEGRLVRRLVHLATGDFWPYWVRQ